MMRKKYLIALGSYSDRTDDLLKSLQALRFGFSTLQNVTDLCGVRNKRRAHV